jgi:hypothetical protein
VLRSLARWLIVVEREQAALFRHLTERFLDVAFVEIVLDRRQGERRRAQSPVDEERRRAERRAPPAATEREHWRVFGYRLVQREEPLDPPS